MVAYLEKVVNVTLPSIFEYFHKPLTRPCRYVYFLRYLTPPNLKKLTFNENEASPKCANMWERDPLKWSTRWFKYF